MIKITDDGDGDYTIIVDDTSISAYKVDCSEDIINLDLDLDVDVESEDLWSKGLSLLAYAKFLKSVKNDFPDMEFESDSDDGVISVYFKETDFEILTERYHD